MNGVIAKNEKQNNEAELFRAISITEIVLHICADVKTWAAGLAIWGDLMSTPQLQKIAKKTFKVQKEYLGNLQKRSSLCDLPHSYHGMPSTITMPECFSGIEEWMIEDCVQSISKLFNGALQHNAVERLQKQEGRFKYHGAISDIQSVKQNGSYHYQILCRLLSFITHFTLRSAETVLFHWHKLGEKTCKIRLEINDFTGIKITKKTHKGTHEIKCGEGVSDNTVIKMSYNFYEDQKLTSEETRQIIKECRRESEQRRLDRQRKINEYKIAAENEGYSEEQRREDERMYEEYAEQCHKLLFAEDK